MSRLETAKVPFSPVTFQNLNFLTISVLSLIKKIASTELDSQPVGVLLILTYHILLLAVSFVALNQYYRSLFANFFATTLLKKCLDDLMPLICRIVNDSLLSGSVPQQFKEAVMIPLLRKKQALMQLV